MLGWHFSKYNPLPGGGNPFQKLSDLFQEVLLYTSGDVAEALSWMNEIDRQHHLTNADYGMADFIQELLDKGFLKVNEGKDPRIVPSTKMEKLLRKNALEEIFSDLQKTERGKHDTRYFGQGDEKQPATRPFEFGDALENIASTVSLRNAQIRFGLDNFQLIQEDLEVHEMSYQAQTSTVLMIDISHSMILYGEDRITPAKKVAMGLAELISTRYPKDTLDILVFGNDAWQIPVKEIPYLQVGPYHTNTVAGLELAMDILRRRKNPNRQIFMITDGKPTCIKKGTKYYQNSFGLDRQILKRTLHLAMTARKLRIPITTFMIAQDPYLVRFVDQFTKANAGKAFYANLDGLGAFVFMDYKENKGRRL